MRHTVGIFDSYWLFVCSCDFLFLFRGSLGSRLTARRRAVPPRCHLWGTAQVRIDWWFAAAPDCSPGRILCMQTASFVDCRSSWVRSRNLPVPVLCLGRLPNSRRRSGHFLLAPGERHQVGSGWRGFYFLNRNNRFYLWNTHNNKVTKRFADKTWIKEHIKIQ